MNIGGYGPERTDRRCLFSVTDSKFRNLISKVRRRRQTERKKGRKIEAAMRWGGGRKRRRAQAARVAVETGY